MVGGIHLVQFIKKSDPKYVKHHFMSRLLLGVFQVYYAPYTAIYEQLELVKNLLQLYANLDFISNIIEAVSVFVILSVWIFMCLFERRNRVLVTAIVFQLCLGNLLCYCPGMPNIFNFMPIR